MTSERTIVLEVTLTGAKYVLNADSIKEMLSKLFEFNGDISNFNIEVTKDKEEED